MTIFISHSFTDKDQFDNIADAFEGGNIPYWKPSEIAAGAPLSDQLRDAISRSRACVFIATKNSVDSAWCNAELGAFWGAGKPVLIFVADTSLRIEKLPRQFQGHYLEKRIAKLVQACKERLTEHEAQVPGSEALPASETSANISRADLVELIESAIDRVTITSSALSAFRQFSATVQSLTANSIAMDRIDETRKKTIHLSLHQFLGLSKTAVLEVAGREWPYTIELRTTTGRWAGFAQETTEVAENYLYRPCLLFRFDDNFRVAACAFSTEAGDYSLGGMKARDPVAIVGRGKFGEQLNWGYVPEEGPTSAT